jgi:predicted CopG family antitoxin
MITTLMISKKTLRKLKRFKVHKRESYEDVIKRLMEKKNVK